MIKDKAPLQLGRNKLLIFFIVCLSVSCKSQKNGTETLAPCDKENSYQMDSVVISRTIPLRVDSLFKKAIKISEQESCDIRAQLESYFFCNKEYTVFQFYPYLNKEDNRLVFIKCFCIDKLGKSKLDFNKELVFYDAGTDFSKVVYDFNTNEILKK